MDVKAAFTDHSHALNAGIQLRGMRAVIDFMKR